MWFRRRRSWGRGCLNRGLNGGVVLIFTQVKVEVPVVKLKLATVGFFKKWEDD